MPSRFTNHRYSAFLVKRFVMPAWMTLAKRECGSPSRGCGGAGGERRVHVLVFGPWEEAAGCVPLSCLNFSSSFCFLLLPQHAWVFFFFLLSFSLQRSSGRRGREEDPPGREVAASILQELALLGLTLRALRRSRRCLWKILPPNLRPSGRLCNPAMKSRTNAHVCRPFQPICPHIDPCLLHDR